MKIDIDQDELRLLINALDEKHENYEYGGPASLPHLNAIAQLSTRLRDIAEGLAVEPTLDDHARQAPTTKKEILTGFIGKDILCQEVEQLPVNNDRVEMTAELRQAVDRAYRMIYEQDDRAGLSID